jgi:hypothetical protein
MTAVLVALYAPVTTARYGYSDDFHLFYMTDDCGAGLYRRAGRPVAALAQQFLYGRIETLSSLGILRGFAVAGVVGLSSVFYLATRRLTPSPLPRAAFGLGLATLPPQQVMAAWASCWLYPAAAVLASLAALVTMRAFAPGDVRGIGRAGRLAGAFLLVWISLATYQPSAMWFWVVAMVCLLDGRFLTSRRYRRQVGWTIAAGLVFLAACFLLFKLYFLLADVTPEGRYRFLSHPLTKSHALVREQVPLALNLWHLAEPARKTGIILAAGASTLLILLGFLASSARYLAEAAVREEPIQRWRVLAARAGLMLLVAACSHAHWLVIDENPINYRVVAALTGSMLVAVFWAILELGRLIASDHGRQAVQIATATILIALAVLLGSNHLHRYWIVPYTTGYRYVLDCLREQANENTRHVHMIRQSPEDGIVPQWIVYDFGRPLSHPPWVPNGLVRAALAELPRPPRIERITQGTAEEPAPRGPGILVIDMRKLVNFRVGE